MKNLLTSKTPLNSVPGLSDGDIVRLRSLGIRTWEEYCAYANTYAGEEFAGSEQFRSVIGETVFNEIVNARTVSRPMGCDIPDASLSRMMASWCGAFTKEGCLDPAVGDFADDDLPHEIRLMEKMPAICDQGMRGTCTAFATVALCEFAKNRKVLLSPQFLYWASKERDGNRNSEGTTLDTVQETLFEDGVCKNILWPYNPKPLVGDDGVLDAGQGPAPEDALEDAKIRKFACRSLSPNAVRQYRKILAGGCPVVIGVAVFNSWASNPMTDETGWVPMPYMKKNEKGEWELVEEAKGGHAMCIVGYVDDASWPGGGYFIVRNSWGKDWASNCKEGAGHALIPYRYLAFFTHSAFTLVDVSSGDDDVYNDADVEISVEKKDALNAKKSVLDTLPENLRPFARILKCETRDFRGALLPAGSCVLSLMQPDSKIVEYNPKHFVTQEYNSILVASHFPDKMHWGGGLVEVYNSVLMLKQKFCATIDGNLSEKNLYFKPFPEFKYSFDLIQVMGSRRICSSSIVADFSKRLFNVLLEDAALPDVAGISQIPAAWREAMMMTVSAKIRKVLSFSLLPSSIYVVEVFATPFEIDSKTGICRFANPSARLRDIVMTCALSALGVKRSDKFMFYSIGVGLPLAHGLNGMCSGNCMMVVSGPSVCDGWDVRCPNRLIERSAYRDFCDRLMPVAYEDVVFAVKMHVDEVYKNRGSLGSGKVTVGEVIEYLHEKKNGKFAEFPAFRQAAVIRAFLQMHKIDPGKYVVCRETDGTKEVFVIPATELQKDDKEYKGRGWFVSLLFSHFIHFIGVLGIVAIVIGRQELESKMGLSMGLSVTVLAIMAVMCICGFVQNWVNYLMSTEEKD